MNQSFANQNIHKLGTLVLLDTPPSLQLGIDNTIWVIGLKFKGIKLIPLGTHYVHYKQQQSFKNGFFCAFSPNHRIIVRRWDSSLEDFIPLDQDETEQYEHAVQMNDLDSNLGPYPYENYSLWQSVSNLITYQVLQKLDPIPTYQEEYENNSNNDNNNNIENDDQDKDNDDEKESDDSDEDQEKQPDSKQIEEKENFNEQKGTVFYTDIPKVYHKNQHGVELTKINFDKTQILMDIIKKEYKDQAIMVLGELQYAFVKFLLGEHYDSFEQWKRLLILITNSESYIHMNTQFFISFVPVFYAQIQQLPNDFFIDPISNNNFIKYCLKNFFELTSDCEVQLKSRCLKLRQLVETKFVLNEVIFEEDNDEAPQIVENFNFIQI